MSRKPLAGFRPLMAAYRYVRFCPIFSVHGQSVPELLLDAAAMVRESRNLYVLSVVDVGATVGGEQLGFALNQEVCPLVFLDISGNKLADAGKFAKALETCSARLQGLVLNGMNLDDTTIAQIFNALTKNRSLFGLQELSILGSKINAKNCRLAEAWLSKLAQVPYVTQITRMLSLGPVAAVPLITNKIVLTKLQFDTLRLVDSVLDDANLAQLVKSGGIKRLLDLSRSSIKEQDFLQLLTAVGTRNDSLFSLVLSGMFPRGRSNLVLTGLDKCKLQLHELVLDGSNLVPDDLHRLVQVLAAAPNLRKLSLCGTFSGKQEGVGTILRSLVEQTNIEALAIAGDGTPGLQREAIPLLCSLFAANRMKLIDFRQNRIGDIGLLTLANFVRASQTLERVFVDDTGAKDLLSLRTFMEACASSSSLIEAPFPAADFARLVGEKKGGDGVVETEFLLLRGRVNVRLCNTRYLRTPRVTSALMFRTDPLLSKLVLNITEQTNQVYSAYRIQHFEMLDDENKVWDAEKWMGIDAPIARVKDAEADTRVKARRDQRLASQKRRDGSRRASGFGSYMESDALMSCLTQRSNDSSEGEDTSGSVSFTGTRQSGPPSFGPRSGAKKSPPATVQRQAFVQPPAEAIPKLPDITRVNEPDLGFMDVWPLGIDDSVSDSQALNDPPSLCPRPLL
jgi:hypothetical protein